MNIAEYSIRKKTITLVFAVVAVVAGLKSYSQLGRLEDPEFTIKDAVIITPYPGATAEEVQKEVTNEIEKACQQLGQLKEIESVSKRGLSIVTPTIKDKYDKYGLPQVWDELRRKVGDAQSSLPPGAGPSIVNDDFGDVYGLYFSLSGDGYTYGELKDVADLLRREFLLVQDVKRVEYWGDQPEAIYIEMQRDKMARLGISQQQIYDTLASKNLVTDAGRVKVGAEYLSIQPTGEFKSEQQFADLLISEPGSDKQIFLGDVANIRRGYVGPPTNILRASYKDIFRDGKRLVGQGFDGIDLDDPAVEVRTQIGRPSIGFAVSSVQGGNVVVMGKALAKRFEELKGQIPLGIEGSVISYQSEAVEKAVNSFAINLLEAVAIVIVVLLFFMGLKSGVLIGAILFITICATFIVMDSWGIMLERISLGALIIALGMLVDNAIVVTEGMKIRIEGGEDKIQAARAVVAQNQFPLLGATFVAVLAFGAIGLSQDSTGEFCRSLFQVLLISLLMSWLTAVTLTPLFCVMAFNPTAGSNDSDSDPYGGLLFRAYKGFLEFAIKRRWLTLLVTIGMFAAAMVGFGSVSKAFFPPSTRAQFMVDLWFPEGTHIRETEKEVARIEEYLMASDDITSVASHIGGGAPRFLLTYAAEKTNTAYAQLLVSVKDASVIDSLSKTTQRWMDENFADALTYTKKFMLGPGDGGKIQIRFGGPESDVLRRVASRAMSVIEEDGGAIGLRHNWRQRVKVIRPKLAEARARRLGIDRRMVAQTLKTSFDGAQVGVYRDGIRTREDRVIPIISRPPEEERDSVDNINDLQIYSPAADRMIPMSQVITGFGTEYEDQTLWRKNRVPTITLHCDPLVGEADTLRLRVAERIENLVPEMIESGEIPPGYTMEWGGEYESSGNAAAGLAKSIPGFVAMMILIVIMLFNNLRQPTIIFLTVPLAMIGVTAGLMLFNQPFGFMALLGALSLTGMLIKNGIVLVDQINLNLEDGMAPYDAVVDSGVSRMRPVMMAAATTVLGMLPLLKDAFFIAMAVSVMFGLSFASVLTLVVLPVVYCVFYRIRKS